MRIFLLGLTFSFIFLPALLILLANHRPLGARIRWGLLAFLAPVIAYGLVQMVPWLANNAADASAWGRFAGLLLTGAGFFLPWILFAFFLHSATKRSKNP